MDVKGSLPQLLCAIFVQLQAAVEKRLNCRFQLIGISLKHGNSELLKRKSGAMEGCK